MSVRSDLDLTGSKLVCGAGVCAPAPCWWTAAPVASCLMPAACRRRQDDYDVEGIGAEKLHPVQKAS
jgi:xanthine dehydrogenase YagR molybdenum-binding subunit